MLLQESCALEQERGDVKRGGATCYKWDLLTFCSLWQINACPRRDSERLNVFDLDESEHFDFVMLFGWVTHSPSPHRPLETHGLPLQVGKENLRSWF